MTLRLVLFGLVVGCALMLAESSPLKPEAGSALRRTEENDRFGKKHKLLQFNKEIGEIRLEVRASDLLRKERHGRHPRDPADKVGFMHFFTYKKCPKGMRRDIYGVCREPWL